MLAGLPLSFHGELLEGRIRFLILFPLGQPQAHRDVGLSVNVH